MAIKDPSNRSRKARKIRLFSARSVAPSLPRCRSKVAKKRWNLSDMVKSIALKNRQNFEKKELRQELAGLVSGDFEVPPKRKMGHVSLTMI